MRAQNVTLAAKHGRAAAACVACAPGYYVIGPGPKACVSCENNSGAITGVENCASCAPPSGGTGPVLYYLMKDDDNSGSTNKSRLSTGAIAIVVVVGGLIASSASGSSAEGRCRLR